MVPGQHQKNVWVIPSQVKKAGYGGTPVISAMVGRLK
jgi:hypothetical protein